MVSPWAIYESKDSLKIYDPMDENNDNKMNHLGGKSFNIKPINTKNIRKNVLKGIDRMSIDLEFTGSNRVSFPGSNQLIIRDFFENSNNNSTKYDPFIFGVCSMELENTTNIKSIEFWVGDSLVCECQNPNSNNIIQLDFFDSKRDCYLIENGFTIYCDKYFKFEINDKPNGEPKICVFDLPKIKLTFIPLLVNSTRAEQIGYYSNYLLKFREYYTQLKDGDYLLYSRGTVKKIGTLPTNTHKFQEWVNISPTNDYTKRKISIYSIMVQDIVEKIPNYIYALPEKGDGIIYHTYPPCMDIIIHREYYKHLKKFCLEQDVDCQILNRGYIRYYTEEQKTEMKKLSKKETIHGYKVYEYILKGNQNFWMRLALRLAFMRL